LGVSQEEAAMPTDNDARAELRLANEHRAADIKRKLADIDRRLRVLEDRLFVDDILNATIGEPEGERPA
jgi:hypothetical protein